MVCFFKSDWTILYPWKCSICPKTKDRKTDWKCCQCSEWVYKDHSIKTIHIKCDNWKEQSY